MVAKRRLRSQVFFIEKMKRAKKTISICETLGFIANPHEFIRTHIMNSNLPELNGRTEARSMTEVGGDQRSPKF